MAETTAGSILCPGGLLRACMAPQAWRGILPPALNLLSQGLQSCIRNKALGLLTPLLLPVFLVPGLAQLVVLFGNISIFNHPPLRRAGWVSTGHGCGRVALGSGRFRWGIGGWGYRPGGQAAFPGRSVIAVMGSPYPVVTRRGTAYAAATATTVATPAAPGGSTTARHGFGADHHKEKGQNRTGQYTLQGSCCKHESPPLRFHPQASIFMLRGPERK